MQNLNIKALSFNSIWREKDENFRKIEQELLYENADLFILPEMFSTGFDMEPKLSADQNSETLNWMKKFAEEKSAAVCGSAAVTENNLFYNRFYFVFPDGTYQYYDKRHLFSYSGEDKVYKAGREKVIVEYMGWKILLQTCYDLRFPVFSRNRQEYDVAIYVASWPASRIYAWETLLKARAIENQAYVFGVNRTGTDGNSLQYPESTYCFFADGQLCSEPSQSCISAVFEADKLNAFRGKFQFLNDADSFDMLL